MHLVMKRVGLVLLLCLVLSTVIFSQESYTISYNSRGMNQDWMWGKAEWIFNVKEQWPIRYEAELALEAVEQQPFLAVVVEWKAENWQEELHQFWYEWKDQSGQIISDNVQLEEHLDPEEHVHYSQLIYFPSTAAALRWGFRQQNPLPLNFQYIKLHFYYPGETPPITNTPDPSQFRSANCNCPIPSYLNRQAWCPDNTCTRQNPSSTEVTHLIIHHSAGSNTSNDWPAVVRSIWNFHVNIRGWDDIGYNWLIDAEGNVYEGRGDNIRGAHFCGNNSNTMGVCMLGTFTDILPADQAIRSLHQLLSWKTCERDLNPLGSAFHSSSSKNLSIITPHRDGCSTECPGERFFTTFGNIRQAVADSLAACTTTSQVDLKEAAITIYPNPTKAFSMLQVEVNQQKIATIYSLATGQRIKEFSLYPNQFNYPINMEEWAAGVYLISVDGKILGKVEKID